MRQIRSAHSGVNSAWLAAHCRSPSVVGSGTGRQTEWGIVETVDQSEAKPIRAMVNGVQRTYEWPVLFEPQRARLLLSQRGVLAALADYLKISPDVVLVMIEERAQDFDDPGKDRAPSEARTSAVRKLLVGRGVDVHRTIAYGVGRSQPSSDQPKTNQGIVLYLVSGKWNNKQPSESVTPR